MSPMIDPLTALAFSIYENKGGLLPAAEFGRIAAV
jgi:hypothetical protein